MQKNETQEIRKCPKCGSIDGQMNCGFNKSGTQRRLCRSCNLKYTLKPKMRSYSEEVKQNALGLYYSGKSGRTIGKELKMSKANIYNWIKKTDADKD